MDYRQEKPRKDDIEKKNINPGITKKEKVKYIHQRHWKDINEWFLKLIKKLNNCVYNNITCLRRQNKYSNNNNNNSAVRINLLFYLFSTVVSSNPCVFLSCRPFVLNTTFSTGLENVVKTKDFITIFLGVQ